MERVLLLGCFWSPYCLTLVAVLFETGRRIVWRERIWGSLNRNIDLRSKVLPLGKIKILLLFRSLIRTIEALPLNYSRSEIKINPNLFCISLTKS